MTVKTRADRYLAISFVWRMISGAGGGEGRATATRNSLVAHLAFPASCQIEGEKSISLMNNGDLILRRNLPEICCLPPATCCYCSDCHRRKMGPVDMKLENAPGVYCLFLYNHESWDKKEKERAKNAKNAQTIKIKRRRRGK